MYPGTRVMSAGAHLQKWVKRAGVDIARLEANDRRPGQACKCIGT
jgi:hypothetical protein